MCVGLRSLADALPTVDEESNLHPKIQCDISAGGMQAAKGVGMNTIRLYLIIVIVLLWVAIATVQVGAGPFAGAAAAAEVPATPCLLYTSPSPRDS